MTHKISGRAALKFRPRKYRTSEGTQGNTRGMPQLQIKAQPHITSSPHLTLAGAQTALDGRICKVTGEELTCTLDEEIHHLNSVKINHHSSTAKGRKKKNEVCQRPSALPVQLDTSEWRTLPSSGLSTATKPGRAAPLRYSGNPKMPRSLHQVPDFNYTCLQKLDHETWAQAWKTQCRP